MNRSAPLRRYQPLQARTGLRPGSPLQRTAALGRSVPLAPVSAKRRGENRQRKAMLTGLYPERPLCAVYLARLTAGLPPLPGCTRWGDDSHEPLTRARGGSITDPGNTTAPCRPCHRHLTVTPDSQLGWAYDLKLLVHSWEAA